MGVAEYQHIAVSDPQGPWTRLEATDVPPTGALLSNNSEYNVGQVSKRRGFGSVWDANEPVTAMYNWIKGADAISTAGSYLVFFNPTTTKCRRVVNLASPAADDLFTQATGTGVVCASGGSRLFVATFTSAGIGAGACRVVGIYGSAINVDTAFLGPITTAPSLAAYSTGLVTKGLHRVGYVIETRNGFIGKLCPSDSAGAFLTTSNITVAAGKQIRMIVNPTCRAAPRN